jgi:glycosidase
MWCYNAQRPDTHIPYSLATNTDYVRSRLAQYGNDLISLGVDGYRLDAAKHIDPADISNIISRLSKKVYITQETIWGSGVSIGSSAGICVL